MEHQRGSLKTIILIQSEVNEMKYITCPYCGANLDPGEPCDCQDKKEDSKESKEEEEKCA